MKTSQKIIKYGALAFAFFLIFSILSTTLFVVQTLAGSIRLDDSTDNLEELQLDSLMSSFLYIDLQSTNLEIKVGDFLVAETNDKDITVKQENDKIVIEEKKNRWNFDDNTTLIVYVPEDIVFDTVNIEAGAGKLAIDSLTTKKLNLELGAGSSNISNLNVLDKATIDGGVGQVNFKKSSLKDLELNLGVGSFTLETILTGKNHIETGVGSTTIKLLDNIENYTIEVEKGLGSISINDQKMGDDSSYGNGDTLLEIEGGIGKITVTGEVVD